jgi:hypothetical protein
MVRSLPLFSLAMLLLILSVSAGTPVARAQEGHGGWTGPGMTGPDWTGNGSWRGQGQRPQSGGWRPTDGWDDGVVPADPGMLPRWKPRLTYPRTVDQPLHGPPSRPAPNGQRYRCDDPTGYFPYTMTCRVPWRSVSTLGPW